MISGAVVQLGLGLKTAKRISEPKAGNLGGFMPRTLEIVGSKWRKAS